MDIISSSESSNIQSRAQLERNDESTGLAGRPVSIRSSPTFHGCLIFKFCRIIQWWASSSLHTIVKCIKISKKGNWLEWLSSLSTKRLVDGLKTMLHHQSVDKEKQNFSKSEEVPLLGRTCNMSCKSRVDNEVLITCIPNTDISLTVCA